MRLTEYMVKMQQKKEEFGVLIQSQWIQLKNQYCIAFTDFWCEATTDATINQIIVSLYWDETKIYSTKQSDLAIFAFEHSDFFANLTVIVEVQLE